MELGKGRNSSSLKKLLIGGALGGVAGLLFAPKSGREIRAGIKTTGQRSLLVGLLVRFPKNATEPKISGSALKEKLPPNTVLNRQRSL